MNVATESRKHIFIQVFCEIRNSLIWSEQWLPTFRLVQELQRYRNNRPNGYLNNNGNGHDVPEYESDGIEGIGFWKLTLFACWVLLVCYQMHEIILISYSSKCCKMGNVIRQIRSSFDKMFSLMIVPRDEYDWARLHLLFSQPFAPFLLDPALFPHVDRIWDFVVPEANIIFVFGTALTAEVFGRMASALTYYNKAYKAVMLAPKAFFPNHQNR